MLKIAGLRTGSKYNLYETRCSLRTIIIFCHSFDSVALKYWTYGDKPGEVREIVPRSFENTTLPPYSINIVE